MATRAIREDDLRKVELLRPLFSPSVDQKFWRELARQGRVRDWKAGNLVFGEGETGNHLLVLLSGKAKVVLEDEEGEKELILAILERFSVVGELAPLNAAESPTRSASLVTLRASVFMELPREPFQQAVSAVPELAQNVIQLLSRIVRTTNQQLRTICMYGVRGQAVRRLFLSCENPKDARDEVVLSFSECPSILQIAQMLGCERETVSNAISWLERNGHIKTRKQGNQLSEVTLTKRAVNEYLKGLHPNIW